jgi:hypothetical protein
MSHSFRFVVPLVQELECLPAGFSRRRWLSRRIVSVQPLQEVLHGPQFLSCAGAQLLGNPMENRDLLRDGNPHRIRPTFLKTHHALSVSNDERIEAIQPQRKQQNASSQQHDSDCLVTHDVTSCGAAPSAAADT